MGQKALWSEDDCTCGTDGHEYVEGAWKRLFNQNCSEAGNAVRVDHGDCIEYQYPNGYSVWNIHGAYHEIRKTE